MTDFGKSPGQQGWQETSPGPATPRSWWHRYWKPELLRHFWKRPSRLRSAVGEGSTPGRPGAGARSGVWIVIVCAVLLCLPIAGMILGYVTRPAAGTASIAAGSTSSANPFDSGQKAAKPAPGRPMLGNPEAPPPSIVRPTPSPLAPVPPPSIATPQHAIAPAPPPPVASIVPPSPAAPPSAKPAFPAVTYPARHDKHFGDSCAGQLTLNSGGLAFSCPGNPDSAIQVATNEIEAVDDNGVRLFSGKKYHFTIPGMNKNSEKGLFTDWLNRVR